MRGAVVGLALAVMVACGGGQSAAPTTSASTTTTLSTYEQMRTWSQTWRQTVLNLKVALTGVDFQASLMRIAPAIPDGLRGECLGAKPSIQSLQNAALPAPDFVFSGNLESVLSDLAFNTDRCAAAAAAGTVPAAMLATNSMKEAEDKLESILETVGL